MKPPQTHSPGESYDPTYYDSLSAVEDRHFWYRGHNRVIAALARSVVCSLPPALRVLEVGCGTGAVLPVLQDVCRPGVNGLLTSCLGVEARLIGERRRLLFGAFLLSVARKSGR